LYNDFLQRPGSLSELSYWVAQLPSLGQTGIAAAISRSPVPLTRLIQQDYQTYLQRAASASEVAYWLNYLQNGGTEEQFLIAMLSSAEYGDRVTGTLGGADSSFVAALYQQLLGRNGTPAEINYWVAALPSTGRAGVVASFVHSSADRSDVIAQYYTGLLHRPGLNAEVSYWANSGLDLLSIEVPFLSNTEFYANG
jgi:hypothetical protein